MVTERILTIELDEQTLVSIECWADVSFGDFEEKHTITASNSAFTHNLRLRGLLAETTYSCAAVSTNQSATVDFTTGSLPMALTTRYDMPTGTPPTGYMLFNTSILSDPSKHWLVIQDYSGNIRWYASAEDGTPSIGLEYEPDAGGIIAGGGFSIDDSPLYPPSIYDTSGVLIERFDNQGDHDIDYRNGSLYSPVLRGDLSCVQRWSLDSLEQTWEWCASFEDGYDINSIAVSEDESVVLATTYRPWMGIVKVDVSSGNMDWRLHPVGSGDLSVDTPMPGLEFLHDVTIVDCDKAEYDICLLVYDNGSELRGYSQILKYGVNESNMTATVLRSFARDGWYEYHSGGVHELPNGNWLIAITTVSSDTLSSYLIVDSEGNELWEMTGSDADVGGYRARNIAPCDIFNHTGMCPE
jgi:hypothetical protein